MLPDYASGEMAEQLPEEKPEQTPSATDAESAAKDAEDGEKTVETKEPTEQKTQNPNAEQEMQDVSKNEETEKPAENLCTISISCATILDNLDRCDGNKVELVPENGWILEPLEVAFYEEESVFNVLQRTCKQNKIHLEYANTPLYNSAYIEGIGNLYEFDVGELSGWMYSVNGAFPNFGSSRYAVQPGDVICWVYTCDLGADVGGADAEQRDE